MNSSGLYGFFYVDVGQKLSFTHLNEKINQEESHTIDDSIAFSDFLTTFTSTDQKLKWKAREVNKPFKFLVLSIVAQSMKEDQHWDAV